MTTLYEIESKYLAIMGQIEDGEGEITPELDQALDINKAELVAKSKGYIEFIGSQDSYINRLDAEIKRLTAIKKVRTTLTAKLKEKLLDAVKLYGDYDAGLFNLGTRKSQAVEIIDLDQLPKDYTITTIKTQPDKAKIKAAIKDGEDVPGAQLNDNVNLKIK